VNRGGSEAGSAYKSNNRGDLTRVGNGWGKVWCGGEIWGRRRHGERGKKEMVRNPLGKRAERVGSKPQLTLLGR